jgi:hypothetical protein
MWVSQQVPTMLLLLLLLLLLLVEVLLLLVLLLPAYAAWHHERIKLLSYLHFCKTQLHRSMAGP